MKFGYARVNPDQHEPQWERLQELVGDDRFVFADEGTSVYERKNYLFLRNMLRAGDVLFVDRLDSLGGTLEDMVAEWRSLTGDLQVDVVTLDGALQLDSRRFKALGEAGQQLEEQTLKALLYAAELEERKVSEQRSSSARQSGKKFGRPPLQMDWELFHQTAQRWADGEIDVDTACALTGSARSSWYKYTKEMGYARNGKRVVKK